MVIACAVMQPGMVGQPGPNQATQHPGMQRPAGMSPQMQPQMHAGGQIPVPQQFQGQMQQPAGQANAPGMSGPMQGMGPRGAGVPTSAVQGMAMPQGIYLGKPHWLTPLLLLPDYHHNWFIAAFARFSCGKSAIAHLKDMSW